MSDTEDPYAVSSDSEDEEQLKKPPPKINIEGRTGDIKDLKAAITEKTEKHETVKDEKRLEEIEELRKAKSAEMEQMKKDFETGKIYKHTDDDEPAKAEDKEKPSGLDKQTLSAFKSKFEKFHQSEGESESLDDRLKTMALEGVGKENMSHMKETFEKIQKGELSLEDVRDGKGVDFDCSESDKRRIMAAFIGPKSEDDIPKDCALCGKTVYPVERLFANKKLYHNNCFRCKTCNKKLSATQYNIHEGLLYCKQHYQEVLHPDRTHAVAADATGDAGTDDEEEDEFATVSKPKQLSSDIVRAGTNIGDELQQIRSLKEKKDSWQSSLKSHENVEKRNDEVLEEMSGKVKERMSKIIAGGEKDEEEEESSDDKTKDFEAIKAQVGDIKNKWKTGEVEKAETRDAESKTELEELRKGGIKVRERFNERLEPAEGEPVSKSYDRNELDTSSAAEARKSFLEGLAYQSGPVEKTANDLQDIKFTGLNAFKDKFEKGEEELGRREKQILDLDIQLNSIKEAIQKGTADEEEMTPEERAERKKKEIEAEFLRYKLARKIQAKKAKEEQDEEGPVEHEEKPHLDVEIKMAGKAREKFKNIESQNPNSVPLPKQTTQSKPSKWDTKKEASAEVVNRRAVEESSSEEEDESAFDVKNLMNKFKNIQTTDGGKQEKANLDELEMLRQQAKNLRKQFEEKNKLEDAEQSEEKRKQLAEEFKRLKEEREKMQQELKAEEESTEKVEEEKEGIQVAADHASKMTAKWEKIHKKEAKKAEKSKMPSKS
uniref:LIM zinc-binding domain-containing protein n=1 Tax=Panagrolaimus sp. PS1159 TaxID=55785 RepID=A0AC35FRZ7_9BILA